MRAIAIGAALLVAFGCFWRAAAGSLFGERITPAQWGLLGVSALLAAAAIAWRTRNRTA